MLFKLELAKTVYDSVDEKVIYEKLGFTFRKYKDSSYEGMPIKYIWFLNAYNLTIEISTLKELVEFTKKYGPCIVHNQEIEIYNDYRE
jgi:hypothetical protein